jgi:15-cis-phytoene desaturase
MQVDVIVVGGGLAGLACAHEIAKQKRDVLLLEAREVLGGRTASWVEDGMLVESGLHKYLGIYRALPRLLEDVGVDLDQMLTWVDALELHARDGRNAYFTAAPYRRPFATLAGALGNNHFIPIRDKFRLARMAVTLLRLAAGGDELDDRSIGDVARSAGVSDRVLADVLHASTSGILFLPVDEFSAYAAMAPLLQGARRGLTMRVGAFNGGMTDVMIRPIADAISRLGGRVRTGMPVDRLITNDGTANGVVCRDEAMRARAVVIATPLDAAQALIRRAFAERSWFQPMLSLRTLSAVTLQCELDRPLFDTDHTHLSDTALCCFAEQSHTTFRDSAGRLSAILFPPDDFIGRAPVEILRCAEKAAAQMGIALAGHVTRYRVVRHPYDFYAMTPRSERLRPTQETPVRGLALAGDYTKQPFTATMEGAVLSGQAAAAHVLRTLA